MLSESGREKNKRENKALKEGNVGREKKIEETRRLAKQHLRTAGLSVSSAETKRSAIVARPAQLVGRLLVRLEGKGVERSCWRCTLSKGSKATWSNPMCGNQFSRAARCGGTGSPEPARPTQPSGRSSPHHHRRVFALWNTCF